MSLDPNTPQPSPVSSWQNQFYAVLRHGVTVLGTVFAIFGGLGLLSADDLQKLTMALHDASDAFQKLWGAIAVMAAILGPVLIAMSGKFAAAAAGLTGQLKSITRNPEVRIPPGSTIVVPSHVADAVPSPQVVGPKTGG